MGIKKMDMTVAVAGVIFMIVIIGEVAAYGLDRDTYSADVELDGDSIAFHIDTPGPRTYSAIAFDSKGFSSIETLYIYADADYDRFLKDAQNNIDITGIDLEHATDQIVKSLKNKGLDNIYVYNGDELYKAMRADGSSAGKGLLVLSYSLPESIYKGSVGDLIFSWIGNGGSIYWAGSPIGGFYSTDDRLVAVDDGWKLFVNSGDMNKDIEYATERIDADGLTEALGLKWSRVLYSPRADTVPGSFSIGYSQDGYASITFCPYEKGMVCIFGGETYERHLADDISQVIASGISHATDVLGISSGSVDGTEEGSIKILENAEEVKVYINVGGYFTVYGRAFDV
ncbi:MAG: hypothetical protein LBR42_02580 [Candidatus Methanoplasma sp.]|jgi:hypothetical protein|nr:hypothetical protein [Candidatus Methanoplasma sp.]